MVLMCAVRDSTLPACFFGSHPAMASSLALSPLNIACRLPLLVKDSLRSFGQAIRLAFCWRATLPQNEPAPGVHLAVQLLNLGGRQQRPATIGCCAKKPGRLRLKCKCKGSFG